MWVLRNEANFSQGICFSSIWTPKTRSSPHFSSLIPSTQAVPLVWGPFKQMPGLLMQYLRPAKAAENFNVSLVTAKATWPDPP